MAERDPIQLIRDQLNRTEALTGLDAEHENFKRWHSETKAILEKIFGSRSIHYQSFLALRFREMSVKAFASAEIDKINASRYKKDLDHSKTVLQSAIKELTLDRTLFKKIQTTPKLVEVTIKGEYFISSAIQDPDLIQAIQGALEEIGLTPIQNMEHEKKRESLRQRIEQIKRSRFGIYDLSASESADTFFELGAAVAMGQEMIVIISKKDSSFPEIIKPLNRIEYENVSDLAEKLKKIVHA